MGRGPLLEQARLPARRSASARLALPVPCTRSRNARARTADALASVAPLPCRGATQEVGAAEPEDLTEAAEGRFERIVRQLRRGTLVRGVLHFFSSDGDDTRVSEIVLGEPALRVSEVAKHPRVFL